MNKSIYGIHMLTLEDDIACNVYDSFSHNEITADNIVEKWNKKLCSGIRWRRMLRYISDYTKLRVKPNQKGVNV